MQKNFNIPDELKDDAPLLSSLGNQNPYIIPVNYFDSLSDKIMHAIEVFNLPGAQNVYTVPVGYFDSFADRVLSQIKSRPEHAEELRLELEEIAPLLNTISRKNLYAAPEKYFDTTPIFSPDAFNQPAKVVAIKSRFKKLLHYGVAASVLFVIAISSFTYVNIHVKHSNKSLSIEQRLATLNEDDIINYLRYDHQSGDFTPTLNLQDNQFQNLLMNASDEEIEHFLDENTDSDEKTVNGI